MTLRNLEKCPGCGAEFSRREGPIHRYMESSPACWAAYGEVLAREYSNPALLPTHRLSVDAYAVQHPGRPSRQSIQSVGVHLIRLCWLLQHGLPPEQANEAMLAAGKIKNTFTWLDPPASLGEITVHDVLQTPDAATHSAAVKHWAQSAWAAWAPHHSTVQEWLVRSGHSFQRTLNRYAVSSR
jgi:hypothetical protein